MANIAFIKLRINPDKNYGKYQIRKKITTDLYHLLGFKRIIEIPEYDYQQYKTRIDKKKPNTVRNTYEWATDFGIAVTDKPITDRRALILSNSFGSYLVPHLAPGFRELQWININKIKETEVSDFLRENVDSSNYDDLIFILHDTALQHDWANHLATSVRQKRNK